MAHALLLCAVVGSFDVAGHVAPMWATVRAATRRTGDLTALHPVTGQRDAEDVESVRAQLEAGGIKNTTECEIRLLAYEYALKAQPQRAATKMVEVFDALELQASCGVARPTPAALPPPSYPLPAAGTALYVDAVKGSDGNAGTEAAPLATVHAALAGVRGSAKKLSAIVLRAGTHFLCAPLNLTAADSGLTLTNYPGEEAWLSGGAPLATTWRPFNVSGSHPERRGTPPAHPRRSHPSPAPAAPNVYVTTLPADNACGGAGTFTGLMTLQTRQRLTRARFPNALPEDRHTVKNLGGRDGLLGYVAPEIKSAARQVRIELNVTTKDSKGRDIEPYDFSILHGFNGFSNGHCATAFDPNCTVGSWRDQHHGLWSSYSYHGGPLIAGGWENEDRGNGFYQGPILYVCTARSEQRARCEEKSLQV